MAAWQQCTAGRSSLQQVLLIHPFCLQFARSVQITFVDGQGRRHVLRGVQGQPLTAVLSGHMDTLGEQSEPAMACRELPGLSVDACLCFV